VELQIPHSVYTEEKKESHIWEITKAPWAIVSRISQAEGL
jgi:hypothetical protein